MVKAALKQFIYQTFRPRSGQDYVRLFTRGGGEEDRAGYPWLYSRVLLFGLLIFCFVVVGFSMSRLGVPALLFAGGIVADLAFVVLLAELYPRGDLPLLIPVTVLFAGGLISTGIIYILYGIANFDAPYADQAWTAFVEETGKLVTTIIILLVLRRREPFICFIIGAAVGGGYSAFENMWYMYHAVGSTSYSIIVGLVRAFGTPFSHAAWAALAGWALSGPKPYKRWHIYAVYAFNYTMHFFVNFPLMPQFNNIGGYAISAVTGIVTFAMLLCVLIGCRRRLLSANINKDSAICAGQLPNRHSFYANVFGAFAVLSAALMMLGPTCVFGGYVNYSRCEYEDLPSALLAAGDGKLFNPDFSREYVEYEDLKYNYSYTVQEGKLISAVQRQTYGDCTYNFTYGYTRYEVFEDEDGNFTVMKELIDYAPSAELGYVCGKREGYLTIPADKIQNCHAEYNGAGYPVAVRLWELKSVSLIYDNYVYYPAELYFTAEEGGYVCNYYCVNPNCLGIFAQADGRFQLSMRGSVPIRMTESIIYTALFAAAAMACGTGYVLNKIKGSKNKNVER